MSLYVTINSKKNLMEILLWNFLESLVDLIAAKDRLSPWLLSPVVPPAVWICTDFVTLICYPLATVKNCLHWCFLIRKTSPFSKLIIVFMQGRL